MSESNTASASERRCAACGVQNTTLQNCGRCGSTSYCGRDCQRRDWKQHKPICDIAKLTISSSQSDDITEQARAHSKTIRKMKKSGMPMASLSMTAFGPVGPGFATPEGVPPNFQLKQQAAMDLKTGPPTRPGARGNMKFEASYRAYYEDLVENRAMWLAFFDERDNSEHAEHTCGILGTLATIYRQRGVLEDCEEVLDMEAEVMERYKRSSEGASMAQVSCCDGLEYKMKVIRYNLCFQLKRYDECIPLFRDLAGYELKYGLDFDSQEYLFMTFAVLGKPPTAKTLKSLTDSEVRKMVVAPLAHMGSADHALDVEERKQRVALMTCAECGREEGSIGEFKRCMRCQSTYYCSKECQKKNWKAHKKACKAAK